MILALLLVGALAGFAAACGDDDSGGSETTADGTTATEGGDAAEVEFVSIEQEVDECYVEPEDGDLTIGFSNPLDANETVNFEARAMQLEVEELGGKFINQDAGGDPDKQVSDIEQLVAQEVDALVVFPLDAKAVTPALKKAQDAGIPVLGIEMNLDSTDPGPGVDTQIWQGRDYASYLQAQAAAELMEPGATFAQIGFAVPVPTIEKSVERAAFWAEEYGLMTGPRADNQTDDIAGGEEAMTEILGQNPDIQGLIAYNEESATGAAAATRQQGSDIPLVGNNGGSLGFQSVEAGTIDATVKFQVPDIGRCAVWGAYDLAQGTDVPETVIAPQPALITSETIADVPTWEDTLNERYGSTG